MAQKGFRHGLWELLRPFGECVQGKVMVRDNNGVSHSFEDFAIRFIQFGNDKEYSDRPTTAKKVLPPELPIISNGSAKGIATKGDVIIAGVESLAERDLNFAEASAARFPAGAAGGPAGSNEPELSSSFYSLYLRRLLASTPLTSHESFAHPVAGVIAINSSDSNPIEHLRKLYEETNEADKRLPLWASNDYLRYYVLVHDEEKDDITRSISLFEQMKRHLGLHCHLLRLRCSKSIESDDDNMPLPGSEWMSAAEELDRARYNGDEDDIEAPIQYIFDSDAIAIRAFVREMATQSIIPTMERHISVWNDQVASRRKGITGRFMNLSRKWAGFGSGSRSSLSNHNATEASYETMGYYRFDTAEATMRRLADYAFMLRDWKLAHSTYDLLRSDFAESKAWRNHAAVNEMATISLLMSTHAPLSKNRQAIIDQMLESAFYSYSTRCNLSFGAARCLLISMELLRSRGGQNVDEAGRWGLRLLESRTLGPIGEALLKERLCLCYSSKSGLGNGSWGSRHRKAAFWSVLAAEAWVQQGKYRPARKCLGEAQKICRSTYHGNGLSQFKDAKEFVLSLQATLSQAMQRHDSFKPIPGDDEIDSPIDVESQTFTSLPSKRMSVISRSNGLQTAPLHDMMMSGREDRVNVQGPQEFK